jgi:hypothetical protein
MSEGIAMQNPSTDWKRTARTRRMLKLEKALNNLRQAAVEAYAEQDYPLTEDQRAIVNACFHFVFSDEDPRQGGKASDGLFWRFEKFIQ